MGLSQIAAQPSNWEPSKMEALLVKEGQETEMRNWIARLWVFSWGLLCLKGLRYLAVINHGQFLPISHPQASNYRLPYKRHTSLPNHDFEYWQTKIKLLLRKKIISRRTFLYERTQNDQDFFVPKRRHMSVCTDIKVSHTLCRIRGSKFLSKASTSLPS